MADATDLTTDLFDIPLDKFSYSGLPAQYRTQLLDYAVPKLTSSVDNLSSGFGQSNDILGQMSSLYKTMPERTGGYLSRLMRGFSDTVKPQGQSLLNSLAGKNMMGSSTAGDQGRKLFSDLSGNFFNTLANLGFQTRQAADTSLAGVMEKQAANKIAEPSSVNDLLARIAELSKASENPFEPYQAFLNLMLNI